MSAIAASARGGVSKRFCNSNFSMQFRGVDGVDVSLRHLIRPSINSPESVFYDVARGAVSSSRSVAVGCSGSFRALGLHFDDFVLSCQSRRRRGRHIVDC